VLLDDPPCFEALTKVRRAATREAAL